MTNAITINGSVQTRINGIGAALRCVAVVGRDVCARHERALLRLHKPGKRLDTPHLRPAAPTAELASASSAPSTSFTDSSVTMSATAWQRPGQASPRPAASVDMYLPPAAWASLVIQRAISA